jgi:hypothetical protein
MARLAWLGPRRASLQRLSLPLPTCTADARSPLELLLLLQACCMSAFSKSHKSHFALAQVTHTARVPYTPAPAAQQGWTPLCVGLPLPPPRLRQRSLFETTSAARALHWSLRAPSLDAVVQVGNPWDGGQGGRSFSRACCLWCGEPQISWLPSIGCRGRSVRARVCVPRVRVRVTSPSLLFSVTSFLSQTQVHAEVRWWACLSSGRAGPPAAGPTAASPAA